MTVKPSTYNNYKRLLIDHIFADIGNKKYTALDKQYINDYVRSAIYLFMLSGILMPQCALKNSLILKL